MNENMLPIGTILHNTYRITKQLNSGGFGNTYVVQNIHFSETYAMKEFFMQGVTVRNDSTVSVSQMENAALFASQKEKFKKEAQRLRYLHHPNIVKIHDFFEENDTYYYTMDYIDGESLAERLKHQGAMQEHEAISVMNTLLDALSAVHAAGLTHMDIKPGNIMQDKDDKIYLIDFGASKQMTYDEERTLSTSTAMCYTEGYAPIEQVDRKMEHVGPWTDLYAVGATLYRLLTNQHPPTGSEITDYLSGHGTDPFFFPKSISKSTQSMVRWMMQPARGARPQSVEDIKLKTPRIHKKAEPKSQGKLSNWFFGKKEDFKRRLGFENFILITIQVVALVMSLMVLVGAPFLRGNTSITRYLMLCFTSLAVLFTIMICNSLVLHWRKEGAYLLFVLLPIFPALPFVFWFSEYKIYFFISMISSLFYLIFLKISCNGKSVWKSSTLRYKSTKYLGIVMFICGTLFITVLPSMLARAEGFYDNLDEAGHCIMEAKIGKQFRAYGRLIWLMETGDGISKEKADIDKWYCEAIEAAWKWGETDDYLGRIYEYIEYLETNKRNDDAWKVYNEAIERVGKETVDNYFNNSQY